MVKIKILAKLLYSWLYCRLLRILVKPPGAIYKGEYNTFPRIAIIQLLERWKETISGEVLDVGVGTWVYPRQLLQDKCNYTATDSFSNPNVDVVSNIHELTDIFKQNNFDFVICTDVLEHIQNPWIAVRQLYSVLKPGGTLLLTTPFNFHLHGNLDVKDYWRISADGLRYLLSQEANFRIIEIKPIGLPEFPFSYTVVAQK